VENTLIGITKSQTVWEFLTEKARRNHKVISPPLFVETTDTLRSAVELMLENHVHRLWIGADSQFPTGAVISMTDIIRGICDRMITNTKK
jgi:signal-transduction protein with cAMP-binding, CBS, and nucleotidyltransferase domain